VMVELWKFLCSKMAPFFGVIRGLFQALLALVS